MLLNRYTVIVVSTGQWIESQRKVGHVRFLETGGGWRIERVAIRKDFMGLMLYLNRPWSGHNFKGQNAGQGVRAGGKSWTLLREYEIIEAGGGRNEGVLRWEFEGNTKECECTDNHFM